MGFQFLGYLLSTLDLFHLTELRILISSSTRITSSSSAKVRFETSAMKLELDPIQDEKCGAMNKFMDFNLDIDDLSQYEIIDEVHQSSPSIPSIEKHVSLNRISYNLHYLLS